MESPPTFVMNNLIAHALMMLAKKYLAIPGSAVPSECLFSKAGELISEKRSQLKPKNVDTILFLNKNLTKYCNFCIVLYAFYSHNIYANTYQAKYSFSTQYHRYSSVNY